MDAFSWIGDIVRWLADFLPSWVVVAANEKGVKFPMGKGCTVLEPGVRWYWPAFTEIEGPIPVVRQVFNVSMLSLLTKDGWEVIAEGAVALRVSNIKEYLVENHDADEAVGEMVRSAIRDVITSKTLDEIQSNSRKTTDNALTREARDSVQGFGVEIEYVRLTSFSTAQAINCLGGGAITLPSPRDNDE